MANKSRPAPRQRAERLKDQINKKGFTATRNYYKAAVLEPTPSYVLSLGDRYEDFQKWARDYSNEFMTDVAGNYEAYTKAFETEISLAEKEEKLMAKNMLKNLGKPNASDPVEKLLILLSKTFQKKIAKYTIEPSLLPKLVEYQIGKHFSEHPEQDVPGSDVYVKTFNRINKDKDKAKQYADAAAAIRNNLQKIIQTGDISSPALLRQLDIFEEDSQILKQTKELGSMYGFSGTLYEPLALMATQESLIDISKQTIKQLSLQELGSTAAETLIDSLSKATDKKSFVIGDKGLKEYKVDTNLSGSSILGKADFKIAVKDQNIGVDVKLSGNRSEVYKVNSPTFRTEEVIESAQKNGMPIEGINAAMNSIINMIQVTGGFDQKKLSIILRPILVALVASEKTLMSFFSNDGKKQKSLLVLVNDKFYVFSDILKSIRKTYLSPRGAYSPIERTNHTFTIAGLEGLISTAEANKSLLLDQKRRVVSAIGKDKNPMERLGAIQSNDRGLDNVNSIFEKYQTALNSVSYKVFLTLNFKKILRAYANK